MDSNFLIAFLVSLVGYIFHTVSHFAEYKGYDFLKSKILHTLFEIIIFGGFVGWGFMIALDPIEVDLSDSIAIPLGIIIGLAGIALSVSSAVAKKGFERLDHLVTEGIYSRMRHPMYLGVILIHIGLPLAFKSLLTLISTVVWIPFLLMWKYMEDKDLAERFGNEYIEYKKRTFF